jgi:hypothetical protein
LEKSCNNVLKYPAYFCVYPALSAKRKVYEAPDLTNSGQTNVILTELLLLLRNAMHFNGFFALWLFHHP